MAERKWHKGPPPHVGWWNASSCRLNQSWRWWDGTCWSVCADPYQSAESAAEDARVVCNSALIEWTDYYPEGARVPRINPAATSGQKP